MNKLQNLSFSWPLFPGAGVVSVLLIPLRCWYFNCTVAELAIHSMELGAGTEAVFA